VAISTKALLRLVPGAVLMSSTESLWRSCRWWQCRYAIFMASTVEVYTSCFQSLFSTHLPSPLTISYPFLYPLKSGLKEAFLWCKYPENYNNTSIYWLWDCFLYCKMGIRTLCPTYFTEVQKGSTKNSEPSSWYSQALWIQTRVEISALPFLIKVVQQFDLPLSA
jgi:hypothetical protein